MTQILAILVAIGSAFWAYFEPIWAWAPLSGSAVLLLIVLMSLKVKRWAYVDELSPSANEMFQRYGHYYWMPFAGRDFSAACSALQFGGVLVGIVGAFQGFWWGLGLTVGYWLVLGPAAMSFNPTNFVKNQPELRAAHEEVVAWVMRGERR